MIHLFKTLLTIVLSVGLLVSASAQKTKSDKKAIVAAEIKQLIGSKKYFFKAEYFVGPEGIERNIERYGNYLMINQDTLTAYLPDLPVLKSTEFKYDFKGDKKGNYLIHINNDTQGNYRMTLSIMSNGYANLFIQPILGNNTRFTGIITSEPVLTL